MAEPVSARLSRGEARRFGLVVGGVFVLLGALFWWRGKPVIGQALGGLGAALMGSGIIAPGVLPPVYRVWMRAALVLSRVTTPILLSLVYFGLITPIGAIRRLLGRDSLTPHTAGTGFWVAREPGKRESDLEHQF